MVDSSTQSWFRAPLLSKLGVVLGFVCFVAGCKREHISVYTVPKERDVEVAETATAEEPSPGAPSIHYKTPPGWTEEQPGPMRVAGFSIPDQKGSNISVAVVPLRINASKTQVVNIWRGQLGLGPVTEAEVDRDIQKVKVAGAEAELFDLVSDKGAAENNKGRVVVAMLPHGGSTWFFKMSGEDESVRAQKPAFLEFLKSVEFRPGHAESPPGRFTSTNVKRVPGGKADTSPGIGARPEWQVPSGWQ